jgi:hypothetical protein
MLKEKAVFISSETDPEFLRRTALQMENNIADLRKDALALYQEYNAALVRSADRINPLYSQMKAWDIVCNKEMSALDRDISRVSGEIDKVPYDVVGRADGPQLIRKRNTLIGELETLTLRKLELRNQVADIGKDISKIEAAARQANVDLNAARTNAVSIANRANSNYNLWKNFEKEKSLNLKTNLANVNQRIEEVAARNLTRQRNLADKGREIGPIKVYASAAFLLLEFAMFGATMSDQHASKKDRSWAFADLGKGFVDFGKDYLSARGIRPELLPKGSVSKLFVLSGTDAALLKEASNLRLKVASGALGILGGLHTVIKYGPQSVKDWRSDDVDASLFAGMAAFGGVLTIVVAIAPFVGFMSVSAASGVGAIASLLTAVGILVYIFVVDSEYEKILKNCYFAKKPTQRNNRFSTSTTHWMGPADPEAPEGFWGVREQLAALTRLSCRFEVTSQANVLNFPTNSFFAEEYPSNEPIQFSALFVLSFNGVPKGASIFIDLRAFQFGGESTQIHALRTSEFEVGAKWNSDKTTLTGRFAPADQSGFILINLKQKSAAFFHRIAANIEYTLPDGSMIKHEHDLIKMKIDSIADNAGGTTHRYYCEVQDGSTYATSFESVPATTYS